MALVYKNFDIENFDVQPGVASPTIAIDYTSNNGVPVTTAGPQISLVFPDGALSAAYWTFTVDSTIGATPALSVRIDWYLVTPALSTGSPTVRLGAAAAVLPLAGTPVNSLTKPFSTAVETAAAIVASTGSPLDPTTFWKPSRTTLALTNVGGDFAAANQPALVGIKVYRDGLAATDTAVGDIKVRAISIVYQDT